ncbi:flagellar basal body P-ring formation chaperone FlgA [Castellaniella sp. GW247-6E4]|uniref:flagellar basal body P-ring formation chaperone FlgA n=1 Tax=Castellaniella sp. GW247-6E4 TaxID=3140380 RepID=UPI00331509E1
MPGRRLFSLLLLIGAALPAMARDTPPQGTQDPAAVAAQADDLLRELAASHPGTPDIMVDEPRITQQPACAQLEAFLPGGAELRPRTSVGIRCLAPQPWTVYVQANVRIMGHYFVANRTINRGEILSLDELDTREGDLLRNHRLIGDPSHIVGWVATRRIAKGSAIQGNALRDPQSIERGHIVRTVARGLGFVATGEGQALQSGGPGAQIQVRTSSGQMITGTVIDAHTVQVMM